MIETIFWPVRYLWNYALESSVIATLIDDVASLFANKKDKVLDDIINSGISHSIHPVVWFHLCNVDEYFIIRPIINKFVQDGTFTVLTTYSSSSIKGRFLLDAEIQPHYLFPLPTKSIQHATAFIESVKPSLAVLTALCCYPKYYLLLTANKIPVFLIADHIEHHKSPCLFRWNGNLNGDYLSKTFIKVFDMDSESKHCMERNGVENHLFVGNTLVDAVYSRSKANYRNPIVERFTKKQGFVVIGLGIDMTQDLHLIVHLANANPAVKFLLAPQSISEESLNRIQFELEGISMLYSECDENTRFEEVQVLIIDYMESSINLCRYGSCAYLGSGSTSYSPSVVEAAVCGVPISLNPLAGKNQMCRQIIHSGIGRVVKTPAQILEWEKEIETNHAITYAVQAISRQFVEENLGSTNKIYHHITSCL